MTGAWTTTKPSQVGWYWVRIKDWSPWIVEVKAFQGGLYVDGHNLVAEYGRGDQKVLGEKHKWFGPLTPPEEP